MDEHVERLSGLYDELLEQRRDEGGRCGDTLPPTACRTPSWMNAPAGPLNRGRSIRTGAWLASDTLLAVVDLDSSDGTDPSVSATIDGSPISGECPNRMASASPTDEGSSAGDFHRTPGAPRPTRVRSNSSFRSGTSSSVAWSSSCVHTRRRPPHAVARAPRRARNAEIRARMIDLPARSHRMRLTAVSIRTA